VTQGVAQHCILVGLAEIEGQSGITSCKACWCCEGASVIRRPDGPCGAYRLRDVILCVFSIEYF